MLQVVNLTGPKRSSFFYLVLFGKIGDDERHLVRDIVNFDPEFKKHIVPFFFVVQPAKTGKGIALFVQKACLLFTAIPKERIDILGDVHVVRKPLRQSAGCTDYVVEYSRRGIYDKFKLDFFFFHLVRAGSENCAAD